VRGELRAAVVDGDGAEVELRLGVVDAVAADDVRLDDGTREGELDGECKREGRDLQLLSPEVSK